MCNSSRYLPYPNGTLQYELTVSDMSVVVGAHKLDESEESQVRHQVQSVVVHESYSDSTYQYDIMLLRLRTSTRFNDKISPICVDGTRFPPDTECWVTGWGVTNLNGKYSDIDDIDRLKTNLHVLRLSKRLYICWFVWLIDWMIDGRLIKNKKAELSQRRPRDAPNIWVPWNVSRVTTSLRLLFPKFVVGYCSDRY